MANIEMRLWPGVVAGVLLALLWLGAPLVSAEPAAGLVAVLGGFVCALAVIVWWAFFSRVPRVDRWGPVVLMVLGLAATPRILHPSVAEGNLGFQFFIYAVPTLGLAFVVWAVVSRNLAARPRCVSMVATVLLACGVWALVRSEGLTGGGMPEFAWRWSATAEERLLAFDAGEDVSTLSHSGSAAPTNADTWVSLWPGLRGPERDGVIRGPRIATDWTASPPVELWRRPIGPGTSSFAVSGNLLYTQEQRGEDEIVSAYNIASGEPVWRHRDASRFWDSHVGAGPRATPAVGDGRVYAFGAEGILNTLNAATGDVVWSSNAAVDTAAPLPLFGFVSSPLVVDDIVIVSTDALVAYDVATGDRRWVGPPAGETYSSPHLLTIDGVRQIVLLGAAGVMGVAPTDGTLLWEHEWAGIGIMQPALTADGDLLINMVDNGARPIGTRRVAVADEPGGWVTEERWTSTGLKPSFSPIVVHDDHAFGFDGRIMACIDLGNGERVWKGGRYGSGQLLLLPDQDLLLVVSERGDLSLVRATPDEFIELASYPAIEGRTWNQPVLIGDTRLVRNGEEMAAFRLARATS